MSSPQIARFEKIIREKLPTHASVDAAVRALREDIEAMRGDVPAAMESDLLQAQEHVRKSIEDVEILHRNSLIKVREKWYAGPATGDRHWPALKGYLQNGKGWDHESVESIDSCSSEIVSLLANPARDQFHCRGLVVGYVQSGKTANMTAVIAKAVDAGYNLVILLGGMTNKLRAQTQRRIEGDVVGRHRSLWQLYTTADDDGDFSIPANGQFTLPRPGFAQLAVMKKEKSRLEAFLKTLKRTTPNVVKSLKALVIDDECDQASVNAAAEEYDITTINEAIRKMLRALPAASYVGYTATPFANVFINPFPHNRDELDDLYPEDFITSLPRPDGYFGAREVFGFDPDDAQDDRGDSAGRDMVRIIPPEEVALLRPSGTKERETFYPELTDELERALLWFLLSCAVRRRRGQTESHMTMLVHASQFVIQHERMDEVIRKWLVDNQADLASGTGDVWRRLEIVWEAETGRVALEVAEDAHLHARSLLPWLQEAVDVVEVVVENSVSEERLDYTDQAKTYIVVGGSVLARGLTLEGLTVSFFLRTSRQYDTLLQMGRWFGFRHGYEDLPRLWSTADLVSNFRALAHIEEEIREDISIYRVNKATPLEFAVRVRSIPGLAITSAAKMHHAFRTSISYEGWHIQTIRFDHRDPEIVSRNWACASRFVDEARSRGNFLEGHGYFSMVPLETVRKFLAGYHICEQHLDLRQDMLLDYLDKAADRLETWHVTVVGPNRGELSSMELGFLGKIVTNVRSRLNYQDDFADIKALMSKRDILVDAGDKTVLAGAGWPELKQHRPNVPLLLLYPINAKSTPRRQGDGNRPSQRVALDAVGDLMGFGIVFPGEKDRSGHYWSVDLDIPTPEQLEMEDIG